MPSFWSQNEFAELIPDVDLKTSSAEFNFNDATPLLLDSLLFSEPTVVRNPFCEKGVLEFALRPNFFRTWDAGCDFEQPHEP
tara:strand:- start:962 stop:1207 length:246 start_codon:yes stop_codon:yes gene_type:complete